MRTFIGMATVQQVNIPEVVCVSLSVGSSSRCGRFRFKLHGR